MNIEVILLIVASAIFMVSFFQNSTRDMIFIATIIILMTIGMAQRRLTTMNETIIADLQKIDDHLDVIEKYLRRG